MKKTWIFLATLLLASCSTTGMSSGSSNGYSQSDYGYGAGVQSSSSIYPRSPNDTYYGD